MIETFIKTITMLVLVGILYQPVTYAETSKVPDIIEMDTVFGVTSPDTISISLRYTPTEEVLSKPPEFILEFGEKENKYYSSIPMHFDNAIDADGIIETKILVITGLKADTVYHYHIIMVYLGVVFDTGDQNFKTSSSL